MDKHWNQLLPVDRYLVKMNGVLQDFDRKVLTLLYQPLLGAKCYGLYMTLWAELEQDRMWSEETTHHGLMSLMQSNLREIYEERIKLEGIGLLKTFQKEQNDTKLYIYELMPPLKPADFFQDGVLNIYLYNRVGKNKYNQLKKFFADTSLSSDLVQITRPFNEVFKSLQPSEMISRLTDEVQEDLEPEKGTEFYHSGEAASPLMTDDVFDFDLFFAGLSEAVIPRKSITKKVKETIKKLSYLYGINAMEMKNVVMNAIDANETIQIDSLRKAARDWYQFEHGEKLPALADKTQPAFLRSGTSPEKELSQEEMLIKQLDSISPKQFLMDLADGIEPAAADLQIVEEVMFKQKLHPGVVNVLIYYVMLKTDMKLSKSYVQKIASHWARKQVATVRSAMELAKQEHRQYQEWAEKKTVSKTGRKLIRKEKLPQWLKEDLEKPETKEEINQTEVDLERKRLEEKIKQYRQQQSE
ncbi:replication initiation and membrane attachment family protein [Peribacillus frigoritolerans]|uniref:replication initiation and membrane attachment family protein n=1 Tax=Peribacillus frigoritolerans TaxID=450367 RepID=UPI001059B74F|nr:replication initiation and membrane attachment family protein [Peribacillus frigoritolerans]TDL82046.1 Replication initiation and membrane attachment protein [Peribacillus frigoritolerans]